MPIISLSVEKKLLERFDQKILEKGYSGRSEAMRELIRDYISEQDWSAGAGESVVVVNVIYDKDAPRDIVSEIQHEYESLIQTSIHSHLDEENCMEVFIAKGSGKKIKKLVERIKTLKGVKQVKYVATSSGI